MRLRPRDSFAAPAGRRRAAGIVLGGVAAVWIGVAGCGSAGVTTASPAAGAGTPAASAPPAGGQPGRGQSGGATPGAPQLALCADPAAVSQVSIARTAVPRQIQPLKTLLPAQVTLVTGGGARVLGRAVCALPRMPPGVLHCPASFFAHITLTFTAAGRRLPDVTIQAAGCQDVTGLGPVRWVARTPAFWIALARAAGVTGPVQPPGGGAAGAAKAG